MAKEKNEMLKRVRFLIDGGIDNALFEGTIFFEGTKLIPSEVDIASRLIVYGLEDVKGESNEELQQRLDLYCEILRKLTRSRWVIETPTFEMSVRVVNEFYIKDGQFEITPSQFFLALMNQQNEIGKCASNTGCI